MPEHKDLVVGVLGASAALAGLSLVFLGVVFSTLQSFTGDMPPASVKRYRVMGGLVFLGFVAGLAAVASATAWLDRQGGWTWASTVWAFVAQLALLLLGGAVVTYDALKR